jgi:hypothetical protein
MDTPARPPFPNQPGARADLREGVLYAVDGRDGNIYYGQVCAKRDIGFLRYRSKNIDGATAVAQSVMSRFMVNWPSIGRAIREGTWVKVGKYPIHPQLRSEPQTVQWPVGTLRVSVWQKGDVVRETDVHDPTIQHLEVIMVYDASSHVPARLVADFTNSEDSWKVGGTVWRERRLKEDRAARFPEQPWHRLPNGWVPCHGPVQRQPADGV